MSGRCWFEVSKSTSQLESRAPNSRSTDLSKGPGVRGGCGNDDTGGRGLFLLEEDVIVPIDTKQVETCNSASVEGSVKLQTPRLISLCPYWPLSPHDTT